MAGARGLKRAEAALLSEKFPEAVVAYDKIIAAGGNLTFYPAPGNFRSRARRPSWSVTGPCSMRNPSRPS
ncbi:MAG: hypothetical protein R3F31_03995 [Verrucomicrobiales bacterium]